MSTFLRKITLFLTLAAIILNAMIFILNYSNNKILNHYAASLKDSVLFVGDSHLKLAIDDTTLNCINFSQSGEPYLFSFYKIERLLRYNSSIKKIYLGFNYNNISTFADDLIDGKDNWIMSVRYFYILPYSEKRKYVKLNANDLPDFLRNVLINGWKNVFSKNVRFTFLGLFENNYPNTEAKKTSIDRRIETQYFIDNHLREFSESNILFLQRIIDLCKEKKIDLILLKTPLHPYYQNQVPPSYLEKYNYIVKQNNLNVEDFHSLTLSDSCFLPDGDHISQKGMALVSKYFKQQHKF